jgi:ABC-type cobalt transport system substrate-binding protein
LDLIFRSCESYVFVRRLCCLGSALLERSGKREQAPTNKNSEMHIQKYLKEQLDQLSYDAESGIAYGSIRLAADLAGLSEGGGLNRALKLHADLKPGKLAVYLMQKGFKGADFGGAKGLPADVITAIVGFYANKRHSGEEPKQGAIDSLEMLAQIGLTVAIKQAIGVAVDDRPPVVSADIAALIKLVTLQSSQIADLSAEVRQLAKQPTTVTREVVARTGRNAKIQELRCEEARLEQAHKDDPDQLRRDRAYMRAIISSELALAAQEADALHLVPVEGRAIPTGTYLDNQPVYRPAPLPAHLMLDKCVITVDKKGERRMSPKSKYQLHAAIMTLLRDFDQELLHGASLGHAIYTPRVLAELTEKNYRISKSFGEFLTAIGYERARDVRIANPIDKLPGCNVTYGIFKKVPTNG